MRRDLDRLKARENKQAQLLSEMKNERSENELQLAREEKRLAEMRAQISRYEEAMGMPSPNASRNAFVRQDEYGPANAQRRPAEYEFGVNRQPSTNLALNNGNAESAPKQYTVRTQIPYEDYQTAMNNPGRGQPQAAGQQPMLRETGQFAGAPRGFARQDFSQRKPEPEGEVVIWNPNDPSQAVPPEVMLGMSPPAPAPARPRAEAEKGATIAAAAKREFGRPPEPEEKPYGAYAAEAFSPDLYLGRGS